MSKGEKVSIKPPAAELNGSNNDTGEIIESDAKTGAGTRALTGAALGLQCGVFALICSPVGAIVGALKPGTTGVIIGSTLGLNDEQVEQLTANVEKFMQAHDQQQAMHKVLVERASNEWLIVEPVGDEKVLSLAFRELGLQSLGGEKISLVISVIAEVTYLDSSGKQRSQNAIFDYESPPSPVDSWIKNYNDFIAQRFEDSYRVLAENIVATMTKNYD